MTEVLSEKSFMSTWTDEQKQRYANGFRYSELHVRTEATILSGVRNVKYHISSAAKKELAGLAVTDFATTNAWFALRSAEKEGVKPIFGVELDVAIKENKMRVVLLAKNNEGYENILQMTTTSQAQPESEIGCIPLMTLSAYNKGVILLSGNTEGLVGLLMDQQLEFEQMLQTVQIFKKTFEHFYLELTRHDIQSDELQDSTLEYLDRQNRINELTRRLAQNADVPLVATNGVYFPEKGEESVRDIALVIRDKDKLSNVERHFTTPEAYIKGTDEMFELFHDLPEAVFNTQEIIEMTNISYQQEYLLPNHPKIPKGMSQIEFFHMKVEEGLLKFYTPVNLKPLMEKFNETESQVWERIRARAEYEKNVLLTMGFEGYMLIVSWINELAEEDGILVGPGRGSAAGSVIALALEIVYICPLRYDLIFERFLNPDRIEMPDVDTDFQDDRRNDLILRVANELGHDRVSQIMTTGTMKARAALRDCARILGTPAALTDRLAKMVPMFYSLKQTLGEVSDFKTAYENDPYAKELIDVAIKVENSPKSVGTHAAGIILSKDPIVKHCSLQSGKIIPAIQASMKSVDGLRLVKQDFLGLRTLTVISNTVDWIEKTKGLRISKKEFPLDDEKTLKMLSKGETIGCFQLESSGMRNLLMGIVIDDFTDLIDCVALYRPGVLGVGMHHVYVDNKHHPEKTIASLVHPSLEEILAPSRGIMVYQEQAMRVAHDIAGFSMSQADTLRKAIGKKDENLINSLCDRFVQGCKETSDIANEDALKIWALIFEMAKYSFNKSHSVCYSRISMQAAYLKANYPVEYMASIIDLAKKSKSPKAPAYIQEGKRMGIEILPPDINRSESEFTITEEGHILFGLNAIHSVGKAGTAIVEERRLNGPFKSVQDFRRRTNVNKTVLTCLIEVGTFDSLGENRNTLLHAFEDIFKIPPKKPTKKQAKKAQNQQSLFDFDDVMALRESGESKFKVYPDLTKSEIAEIEFRLLGQYITFHPLDDVYESLMSKVTHQIEELHVNMDTTDDEEGNAFVPTFRAVLGGMITEKKVILTKKNKEEMMFLTLFDMTENIDLVIFPKQYKQFKDFEVNDIVILSGNIEYKSFMTRNDDEEEVEEFRPQMIVEKMTKFEDAKEEIQMTPIPDSMEGFIPMSQYLRQHGAEGVKVVK